MTIEFVCDCGRKILAQDELSGQRIRCPECREPVQVPQQPSKPGFTLRKATPSSFSKLSFGDDDDDEKPAARRRKKSKPLLGPTAMAILSLLGTVLVIVGIAARFINRGLHDGRFGDEVNDWWKNKNGPENIIVTPSTFAPMTKVSDNFDPLARATAINKETKTASGSANQTAGSQSFNAPKAMAKSTTEQPTGENVSKQPRTVEIPKSSQPKFSAKNTFLAMSLPTKQPMDPADLMQIAKAVGAATQDKGAIPGIIQAPSGAPLLSWRVAILPYLGHKDLYDKFRLDEPWDGPTNFNLLQEMPREYGQEQGFRTAIRSFVGPGCCMELGRDITLSDITDGPEKTVVAAEFFIAVPWTKPEEVMIQPGKRIETAGRPGQTTTALILANGTLTKAVIPFTPDAIRPLITRSGGEKPTRR